jgi:hypothetical protein
MRPIPREYRAMLVIGTDLASFSFTGLPDMIAPLGYKAFSDRQNQTDDSNQVTLGFQHRLEARRDRRFTTRSPEAGQRALFRRLIRANTRGVPLVILKYLSRENVNGHRIRSDSYARNGNLIEKIGITSNEMPLRIVQAGDSGNASV